MRVIQIGNFRPEHSTENHLRRALSSNGHQVLPFQEDEPSTFLSLGGVAPLAFMPDFVLWTRTGWDWDGARFPGGRLGAFAAQHRMLRRFSALGIPVIGYHLDIWFGLPRSREVDDEPFFHVPLLITADGGHHDEWLKRGVNHMWMPPAVSAPECEPGMFRDEFHSKIAFVGSWQGHYHPEHQHRFELVDWLRRNFPRDCAFWPKEGRPAVRGADLRDLYASVDVLVGDSCFVGTGLRCYWSDRIPETLGRGGVLLHPDVPGLTESFHGFPPYTWNAGDWDGLGAAIERTLASDPKYIRDFRETRRSEVLAEHTYERRMADVARIVRNWH